MHQTTTCSSPDCQAPVVWREHQRTGKRAPIDALPDPHGNVVLDAAGRYRILSKKEMAALDSEPTLFGGAQERYMPHWATCLTPEHFRSCRRCHRTPCECSTGRGR